jgi:phytoene dehydrogenase-like protein
MSVERFDDATLDLQDRARRYTDEVLIPLEVEAELADGKLPDEAVARVKRQALAAGLTGGPSPFMSGYATPVHGLYLCGAGTHPGGGVMAASGHNAAKRILKDGRFNRLRRRGTASTTH